MANPRNTRLNISATLLSACVALTLVALKLWAFSETSSLSVAASLADSALDLIMSLGALTAVIYAATPPDEEHAFGHSSAEDIAALAQSAFVLVSAIVIGWAACARLLSDAPVPLAAEQRGITIMVISIALTIALVIWQRWVVKKTGSRVVSADALHYLGDLAPALGAILALWASAKFGLQHVDSVVALATALFLLTGAFRIGKGAFDALMDRGANPEIITGIEKIAADFPGIEGFHDLKTRTAGSQVFVNLHVEIDGDLSLHDAHAIGAALRRAIIEKFPQADVIIHKDPAHLHNGKEQRPE